MNVETIDPITTPKPLPLDGISIKGNAFEESKSSLEPRPPLFCSLADAPGALYDNAKLDGVWLAVNGGKVLVKESSAIRFGARVVEWSDQLGVFKPHPPAGPIYTGPITPSMRAIINRWWNP